METDIGAPYYSDQQLFPGFMMAEYDGTNTTLQPRPLSSLRIFSFARVASTKTMYLYAVAAELNCTTECNLPQANAG
jgi:hypothetical protein